MTPYLTEPEIAHITAPLTQPAARCRWLREQGLIVRERPNGEPLVGRAHFEEWSGKTKGPAQNVAGEQPDTAALLRFVKRTAAA
jgi:hypothetical protein